MPLQNTLKQILDIDTFLTLTEQLINVTIAIHFSERASKIAELLRIKFELEEALRIVLAIGIRPIEYFSFVESIVEAHIVAIYGSPAALVAVVSFLNSSVTASQAPSF